jgi:serine/threonine protein kinase/WD40 repeat protein
MSSSESGSELVLELAEEFIERYRKGERPPLREYINRHPELAAEIREVFPAMAMMENIAVADESMEGPSAKDSRTPEVSVKQLGDYRIIREIGRGGMGLVYEAEQVSLGRHVALKLLPNHALHDAKQKRRFEREARAAAKLHHTNIVPVFGVGEHDGVPYYVMQFIQGLGLDTVLEELNRMQSGAAPTPTGMATAGEIRVSRRDVSAVDVARSLMTGGFQQSADRAEASEPKPQPAFAATLDQPATGGPYGSDPSLEKSGSGRLSDSFIVSSSSITLAGTSGTGRKSAIRKQSYWLSVANIGRQVAEALEYAHKQGIQHRDVKPSNLLLDMRGTVWVTDFGLAKVAGPGAENLTHTGDILGTLRYMPPEAFEGKSDARGDVYSLGITLYELLAMRPAFDERDRNKLIRQVTSGEPASLDKVRREIPRDLVTIVQKSIAREPSRRYATAEDLASDLQRFLDDEPIQARRQTHLERSVRWARHHPSIAVLGGVLTAVLVLVTVASLLAAGYFNRLSHNEAQAAQSERKARHDAEVSRQAESSQRQRAEMEKKRADVTLADMYTSRGLLAGERDAPAESVLWFAAAADQSATAEDSQRQEYNRIRARDWMRQATLPVATMRGVAKQFDFQPRGDLLLVRFGETEIIFWSWRDGKRLPWAEKMAGVCSAQFSPDGASVALGFLSGEAQIRKVSDGELIAKIQHPGQIRAMAFSPDGKFLAVAGNIARVWDINGQKFLDPVWSHPQQVSALAFNRKGDRLITACHDKRVRVFAVENNRERKDLLYAPVVHIVASPPALIDEDRNLVTVTGDSELSRWDLATGKPASTPIRTKPRLLQEVVASPDGNWFVTGGYYGPELYAADAKQPPVHLGHTNQVQKFVFSPDNTMLLSVSWDQTARLWSLPSGQPLGQPLRHMANVDGCAWSHDSRYLVTAQNDGLIRVWQRPVHDLVIAQETGWGSMTRPRVSFDGRLVAPGLWHEAAMGNRHQNVNRLRVVATANGQPAGADIPLPGTLVDSCVCGDNLGVAAVWSRGEKGHLGVWDVATARARFESIPLPGAPISIAARPGSGQLAVICATGDLLVIDDTTGKRVLELRHEVWASVNPGRAVQVQYTPDGKTIVSLNSALPAAINVRDADSGRLRFAPLRSSVDGSNLHGFALSDDSRLLATMALVKNNVQVWDLATGRALSEPLPHPGDFWGIFSVRFSPDGRYLLTSHKDGQARYWDWKAGKLACPPMAHDNEIHDAAITADGRFALTAISGRPEMHVWELTTGRRVAPPLRVGFNDGSWCSRLAITPDGRRSLIGLWPMDLSVVDLEPILSPCTAPTADLALLAELATSQRIELGDLSGLTTDQWQERWNLLRERNPDLARSFLIEPRPEVSARKKTAQAAAYFARGEAHARLGKWKEAAGEIAKVAQLNPNDVRLRILLANLFLQMDDTQGYRKLCEETAKELDQLPFDLTVANNTVWLFCLSSGAVPDYKSLVTLAERALKEPWNEQQRLVHLNTLGVILFRAGRYQEAIDRLNERVNAGEATGAPVDWVFLAMAHHRLGNKAEAKRWLEKFRANKVPDYRTSRDLWNDLEIRFFAREVEALLAKN